MALASGPPAEADDQAAASGISAVDEESAEPSPERSTEATPYRPGDGWTWASTDDQTRMTVRARVQVDHDRFSGAYNADANGVEASSTFLRRARLSIEGRHGRWSARMVTDHVDPEPRWVLAHISYTFANDGPTLSLGLMKEDVSLEAMTGSRHSTAISRPMLANAFSPFYSYGVRVSKALPASGGHYALGLYRAEGFGSDGRDPSGDLTLAVTGRRTASFRPTASQLVHLGLWGSRRDFGGDRLAAALGRGEVRDATVRLVDSVAGGTPVETHRLDQGGLEAALIRGPLSLQAEYSLRRVHAIGDSLDRSQEASYLTASYFVTGQSRAYDDRRGVFVTPRTIRNAWELLARVSTLDAAALGQGTEATVVTVGVNFYRHAGLRWMLNYLRADVEGPGAAGHLGSHRQGEAFVARFEVAF